jgi:elongation factor G
MEMFGYATQLRNLSSGRANYSMEFYKYMPLPKIIQDDVLKKLEEKKREEKK